MGGLSVWHWLVVGIIILLLFGKGRFSAMMGDVAKGMKSFKKGITEDEDGARPADPPRQLEGRRTDDLTAAPAQTATPAQTSATPPPVEPAPVPGVVPDTTERPR